MNDSEALQGLWRIESSITRGRPVGEAGTHYLITGNSMKQIIPNYVPDGTFRMTFELDEAASPKRLTKRLDYNGPNGPPDPNAIVLRYLYQLDGDTLILCSGLAGICPDRISDDEYSVLTLVRDYGPVPETRSPSGTPPLIDELLGTLEWDDNLNWYHGQVNVAGASFDLSLNPNEGTDVSTALSRAKQIIGDFERYRQVVTDYAVEGLLDLKNEVWLHEDEDEVSADEFKSKMTLEAITVESDGGVTFWHRDGDLFWGHSIQVCIDSNDKCSSTDIPG